MNSANRGPHASACARHHVLHAACSVRGTRRAGFRDDALVLACTGNRAGSVHGKPRRFGARVTSSARTLRRELRVNSARCPAWGIPRKRALVAIGRATTRPRLSAIGGDVIIANGDERASCRPPPWRCKKRKKKKKSLAPSTLPGRDVASILFGHRSTS